MEGGGGSTASMQRETGGGPTVDTRAAGSGPKSAGAHGAAARSGGRGGALGGGVGSSMGEAVVHGPASGLLLWADPRA
jgi:hypothetical protein